MNRVVIAAFSGLLLLAPACSSTPDDGEDPAEEQNSETGGKSDTFESESDACTETGGTWTDDAADAYYCICPDDLTFTSELGCVDPEEIREICEGTGGTYEEGGGHIFCHCPSGDYVAHGNCLLPDPEEEALCTDSGGTWTDDASDSYYCICPDEESFVEGAGCATSEEVQDICEATGGTYDQTEDGATCNCPGDRALDHGNCLASEPGAKEECLLGGGTWTDNASDSYYCLCAPDQTYVSDTGCVAREEVRGTCEATGGTFEEGEDYAYCECQDGRILDDGNCLAPNPEHEQACLDSGGTWTDDASDSYYCVCPDGTEIYDGSACE
jgi:hypothetical protein